MKRKFFLHSFITTTLPAVLASLILGTFAVIIVNDHSREAILNANEQALSSLQNSMETILAEADAQSLSFTSSPHVMNRLKRLLINGYKDKEQMDITSMLKAFIDSSVNTKPYLNSLYVYLDNDNQYFFSSYIGLSNSQNHYDTAWMEEVKEKPEQTRGWISKRIRSSSSPNLPDREIITVFRRLYAAGSVRSSGVMAMNIDKNYLDSMCSSALSFDGQIISILTDSGELLGSSNSSLQGMANDGFHLERSLASGIAITSDIPGRILRTQSRDMIRIVLFMVVIALTAGMLLSLIASRQSSRKVETILSLISCSERGEPLPELQEGINVYGYISQNILKNYLEKNALDKQLMEKEFSLERMEFSFLQSQLNPHFLFNTLKNIFWKTVKLTGGPNDASHMIDLLSSLLYYNLMNRDRYVTIGAEYENTMKYIEIQQLRFDHSFRVVWEVDETLYSCKCIKFLLQPLLENSISHGLRAKRDGEIRIRIERSENRIHFLVTDNGIGITPKRQKEICTRFADKEMPVSNTGLYNLNKRLQLAYNITDHLQITSVPDRGSTVSFYIPLIEAGAF